MKKLLVLALALGLMTGCGEKQKTTVCQGTMNGVEVTNTIAYTGDEVDTIVYENHLTLDETTASLIESIGEQYKTTVESIAGVTYEYEIDGLNYHEITTINFAEADIEMLQEAGLVTVEEGQTINFVGYQKTVEAMSGQGLVCIEK